MSQPTFTCCPEGYTYNFSKNICETINMVTTDPIECPSCCPEGYVYNQAGHCCPEYSPNCTFIDSVPSIPCIPCDCSEPPQRECQDCSVDMVPIAFTLNTTSKACTDCEPNEGFRDLPNNRKVNKFLPYFLIDPVTNFIRK